MIHSHHSKEANHGRNRHHLPIPDTCARPCARLSADQRDICPSGDVAVRTGTNGGMNLRLVALEAEARHARERYQLYRAKAYGPRLTSAGRLRELERKSKLADSRLDRARADQRALAPDGASGI